MYVHSTTQMDFPSVFWLVTQHTQVSPTGTLDYGKAV